jgi:hypothetical protein
MNTRHGIAVCERRADRGMITAMTQGIHRLFTHVVNVLQ